MFFKNKNPNIYKIIYVQKRGQLMQVSLYYKTNQNESPSAGPEATYILLQSLSFQNRVTASKLPTETGPWFVLTSEPRPGTVQEVVLADKPCDHLNNLTTQIIKFPHAQLKSNIFNFLTLL